MSIDDTSKLSSFRAIPEANMTRVVPSQVVALIDRSFPGCKENPKFPVYSGNAGVLSAIVSLADEIPEELLTISGDDYTDLVHGMKDH